MATARWELPWLRLHLVARHLLTIPASAPEWPEVKRELVRCAELRHAMIQAGVVQLTGAPITQNRALARARALLEATMKALILLSCAWVRP